MDDVRTYLIHERVFQALTDFGREVVAEEIENMIYDDLADKALWAAHVLQEVELARVAAQVINNSGGYGEKARKLAALYS